MKTLLFCLLMTMLYYPTGNNKQHPAAPQNSSISDSSHSIAFETQVKPIFVNHCSPCHFTGGKMYEKLPFDKRETIVNHQDGILKRIKDEKEVNLIKEFIAQQKKQ